MTTENRTVPPPAESEGYPNMADIDHARLRELAEAALASRPGDPEFAVDQFVTAAEFDFDIAASPQVVLALLDGVKRLRSENALRERDAEKWAAGYRAGYSDRSSPGEPFTRNPYRGETASIDRRDGKDEAHKRSTSGTITHLRAILARIARQAEPPHPHPRLAAIHHIVKELEATGDGGLTHAEAQ